jgi:hypothetical protein
LKIWKISTDSLSQILHSYFSRVLGVLPYYYTVCTVDVNETIANEMGITTIYIGQPMGKPLQNVREG